LIDFRPTIIRQVTWVTKSIWKWRKEVSTGSTTFDCYWEYGELGRGEQV